MNRTQRVIAGATIVSAFVLSLNALAHPLSRDECTEGSDFIKNVARSRENGMDGMAFLAQTIADFAAI